MPATTIQSRRWKTLWTYGKDDTAPNLVYQIRDQGGQPVYLTQADLVTINVAHATYDPYFAPGISTVVNGPCTIIADPVNHPQIGQDWVDIYGADCWVEWPPQPGDLAHTANFKFVFLVKWLDGTYSTHKNLATDFIKVQAPPFANTIPRT